MNWRALAVAAAVLSLPNLLLAQASSAYLSSTGTAAVDAKGMRHTSKEYPARLPPWMADRVRSVAHDYPRTERAQRHTGVGYFQLTLDLKMGVVTSVGVKKSTGYSTLDNCAVAALRQWRWKPGRWKEIETPVTFRLASTDPHMPPGSVPLTLR
jgi:TonB family protein